uniref:Uncharacterized protein n=1 Tax=Arundo donax TaxID=35708 RepID=A0A0A9GU64_ARUDO
MRTENWVVGRVIIRCLFICNPLHHFQQEASIYDHHLHEPASIIFSAACSIEIMVCVQQLVCHLLDGSEELSEWLSQPLNYVQHRSALVLLHREQVGLAVVEGA